MALAVKDVIKWSFESTGYRTIRQQILAKWGNENFTDAVMNRALLFALHVREAKYCHVYY